MYQTVEKAKKHKVGECLVSKLSEQERQVYERVPVHVDFVPHESFDRAETEQTLFGETERLSIPMWTHFPGVPDDHHTAARSRKALTREEEARLFLRYNYARYRLSALSKAQARRQALGRAHEMLHWFKRVLEARSDLVNANMALVLAMAKRMRIPNVEFNELISEGNLALLRSVEKFDISRGFKFSTYGCRAILKSFNRLATKTGRYRSRFPTEYDPDLERSDHDDVKHDRQHEDAVDSLREILFDNRADLSELEQTIVRERFALNAAGQKRTLAEVGQMVGLTNERVRQLQNSALSKLRAVLDKEYLTV
ncbi:hypothetical protein LCGC14_0563010 [marine sediment metagenome]|uniref:RNA polymerase sigma-70 domain-containing protein n=1 Tax=marine sediment metagenome TaxID=412755 RepID=A0A0F9UUR0_9ZZZZ|nr:sigma-70 family RNA polymerase sigma factor [Phycisphaerae bacterium]HDZ44647.1 sigma-70 family RNA polymerase sigma factor [Phycisphaerae bacterium]